MISGIVAARIAAGAALAVGAAVLAAPAVLNDDNPGGILAQPPTSDLSLEDGRFVSAWLPDWTAEEGFATFKANSDLFTDLTTFFHTVTGENAELTGSIDSGFREKVVTETKAEGVVVLAAVLDRTEPLVMSRILSDPTSRAAHINQLLTLVDDRGYDGIDIDYENFAFEDGTDTWATTRPGWVAFIQELSAQLHLRKKFLTVAVPPQFNAENNATSGYWVYDWPAIANYVDTLRVMTYDYSLKDPGPISPIDYVQRATSFGLATLGPDKFRIGVPTYGRDWITLTNGAGCATADLRYNISRPAAAMIAKAAEYNVPILFDPATQEALFAYTQSLPGCDVARVVHFSDGTSVAAKARFALENETGIALWSLGGEDPATWDLLRSVRSQVQGE